MATTTPSPGLGGFWRDLPREGRLLLSIVVIEFLGTGLVLPFHVVYLHEVRGFPLSDVGLLLGAAAADGAAGRRARAARPSTGSAPGGSSSACCRCWSSATLLLAFATTRPVAAAGALRSTASRSACPGRPGRA